MPTKDYEMSTSSLLQKEAGQRLSAEQLTQLHLAESDIAGQHAAILVVEDSDQLRALMVLMLQALGYRNVSEARDGQEALDLLRQREFDLLVLDIEMPRLDGFGVLEALRNQSFHTQIPVIVTSGLDALGAVVRCIELGAEDFLPKPTNSVLLRARVAASLERKRLRDLERLRLLELQQEKQLLKIEQEKSERLLLNILPTAIAGRLKQGERNIAERYACVTVLFADLVGFTSLANQMAPEALVDLLNDLFSRFDQLTDSHNLEKIKTIGDCYMVVGGVPEPRPDHAEAAAEMALQMLNVVSEINQERDLCLSLRIGLNSGPVVAGVIGRKKFSYDLWGEAVNLAERMESSGLPNRIQVPTAMYEQLSGRFQFTDRGYVTCKGLGEIRTYFLDGKTG